MSADRGTLTIAILCLAALASGCQSLAEPATRARPAVVVEPPLKADAWLRIASPADTARIRRVGPAWTAALAEARKAGFADAIAAEGDLLKPWAGLARPAPTPGSYNCRLIKLGRVKRSDPAFERFKPFYCYVEAEGDLLTIVKQTGSERPAGRLWEDDNMRRLIFLGSLALGDRQAAKGYGDDVKRDMAGIFERVGPFRFRLVIPWPRGNSKLDVFELTPVAEQPR